VTIRDVINRRKRKAAIVTYAGFALLMLGALAAVANESLVVLALPGFAIFMGGTLFLYYGIRCPRCRARVGHVVNFHWNPFAVPPKMRFCPFCGVALDSQFEDTQNV
jgi:hypothetical protein